MAEIVKYLLGDDVAERAETAAMLAEGAADFGKRATWLAQVALGTESVKSIEETDVAIRSFAATRGMLWMLSGRIWHALGNGGGRYADESAAKAAAAKLGCKPEAIQARRGDLLRTTGIQPETLQNYALWSSQHSPATLCAFQKAGIGANTAAKLAKLCSDSPQSPTGKAAIAAMTQLIKADHAGDPVALESAKAAVIDSVKSGKSSSGSSGTSAKADAPITWHMATLDQLPEDISGVAAVLTCEKGVFLLLKSVDRKRTDPLSVARALAQAIVTEDAPILSWTKAADPLTN